MKKTFLKMEPRRRESTAPRISVAGRNPAPKANALTIHPLAGAGGLLVLWVMSASIGLMLAAMPVLAATSASLSPSSVSVTQGQNFNLTVSVNPVGVKNYTIKIKLDYPADLLEATSFTFGSSWMPLSQTGYDLIDNTNGVLIKTGGYPGGLTSSATFGTISFAAKKSGSGLIKFNSASMALDAANQNVFSGGNQTSVTIAAAAASQSPKPTTSVSPAPSTSASISPSASPSASVSPAPSETATASPSPIATTENQAANLFAGIGNILSLGSGSVVVAIVVILLVLIGIVYLTVYLVNRSKRSKIE